MNNKSVIAFYSGFLMFGLYQIYVDNKMMNKIKKEQHNNMNLLLKNKI
jgi:hypothetical protein